MKNILYILLFVSVVLFGCEQNQIDTWEDNGRIGLYFFVPENEENESEEVEYADICIYESLRWVNFCNEFYADRSDSIRNVVTTMYTAMTARNPAGLNAFYVGKTETPELVRDTLLIGYTGLPQNGFIYRLQAWPETSVDSIAPYSFVRTADDPVDLGSKDLYFPGNNMQYDTLILQMELPQSYGHYNFQLGIDSTDVQFAGIEEWQRWNFSVDYSYDLDYGVVWPEVWLGEFSEEKHVFLQTVLHLRCDSYFITALLDYSNEDIKAYIWQPLHDALAEYNATYPDEAVTLPAEEELPEDELWKEEFLN